MHRLVVVRTSPLANPSLEMIHYVLPMAYLHKLIHILQCSRRTEKKRTVSALSLQWYSDSDSDSDVTVTVTVTVLATAAAGVSTLTVLGMLVVPLVLLFGSS
jgi:hypothetical protein